MPPKSLPGRLAEGALTAAVGLGLLTGCGVIHPKPETQPKAPEVVPTPTKEIAPLPYLPQQLRLNNQELPSGVLSPVELYRNYGVRVWSNGSVNLYFKGDELAKLHTLAQGDEHPMTIFNKLALMQQGKSEEARGQSMYAAPNYIDIILLTEDENGNSTFTEEQRKNLPPEVLEQWDGGSGLTISAETPGRPGYGYYIFIRPYAKDELGANHPTTENAGDSTVQDTYLHELDHTIVYGSHTAIGIALEDYYRQVSREHVWPFVLEDDTQLIEF